MRRKGLLLAIIAAFWASSMLSYHVLTSNASEREIPYISIENWGEEVEVPKTGGEKEPIILAVLDADEVTNLENSQGSSSEPLENAEATGSQVNQEADVQDSADGGSNDLDMMSDEVLEKTVENLRNNEEIQTGYIELAPDEPAQEEFKVANAILLAAAIVIALAAGAYFTYQHFMR